MPDALSNEPSVLLRERYVIDDQAPNNEVYGPERRYGVLDTMTGKHAMLPNAALCWGLTHDEALDALLELRGGPRAHSMRDGERDDA